MANQGGRPLKFQSVEDMQEKIAAFFKDCDIKGLPYTITGLALALDTSRETLLDYEEKDGFSDTIKRAKLQCQNYTEVSLYNGKNATGAIFSLKNNYGWVDKTEQDLTTKGEAISQPIGTDLITAFVASVKDGTKQK